MLIDEAHIIFKGGHGGPGRVSFYPGETSGPDGGNGGRGGDVYIVATSDLTALRPFTTKKMKAAENGEMGGKKLSFGSDGKDIEVTLPVGTVLTDRNTEKVLELTKPGERILFCKGGLGGRGNADFKSSVRTTPKFAQPGLPGEEKDCIVELKLIADFGLIGLPNAGKSSLLNELTAANVKVANYPFTTLEPNLGALANNKIIADIPGLIEGAHEGKGLGIKFLKHIEKVGVLLHAIAADSDNVLRDYQTIYNELHEFKNDLNDKKEIIILTKTDMVSEKELKEKMKTLKKLKREIITASIYDYDSIEALKKMLLTENS
jgi:GTPase